MLESLLREGFSLVVERGLPSRAGRGLLTAAPLSLRSRPGSRACGLSRFGLPGSVVVVLGLSCSRGMRDHSDQGGTRCPLHWRADFESLSHQGSLVLGFLTFDLMKRVSGFAGCSKESEPSDSRVPTSRGENPPTEGERGP